ncbi:hypothetical protein Achl_4305 (plasmid) [Pseudarthrobacter chlorophenolicus A6]|uniref:Uncharacterized protein n=1 Tax=Pseudarthrobacter chlorophenolicus (strain ATCC 700700 / DSM 12829 / CIP 107037 / JCM 12360 / KCTC 9906 / NCIMB 13794 / A6) TaxID=452863 RepID=B8HIK9_PSECP|nr:hypothetical protein [Pseudarthrobacter chlorophenolicus]ACL42256.1 hypothetical protein Achl_4305 [Pseudarthrobacter chlorophenolicus A6]SDQ15542.1 hypothetical protein SAMN04489738_0363 [Pseudarthrobacter chlorophenolicus]
MPSIPRTILAGELTSEHRGQYFRSLTYPNANKSAREGRHLHTYQADTIHHLKNGAVLVNGSHPYLRPDSVLTVWDPIAGAPEMVDDGILGTVDALDALPITAIIMNPDGNPHAYQKRWCLIGGQKLARWFCTTDTDWPESSERLLRDGATYTVLWLPKGTS